MGRKIRVILVAAAIFFIRIPAIDGSDDAEIHVTPGPFWKNYYIAYTLTPENTRLGRYASDSFTFRDGRFKIYIPKDKFPIPVPPDNAFVIVVMPPTMEGLPAREELIAEKKVLYDRIKEMKAKEEGKIDVIVQLTPYVTVMKENPLTVELDTNIVFFRTRRGRYINHVNPADSE